jgi:hypothetical protein
MFTSIDINPTAIPLDFLKTVEFLPDGTATDDKKIWLQAWAEYTQTQVANGKLKIYDVPEFDPDTGQVPNEFIHSVYLKNRRPN